MSELERILDDIKLAESKSDSRKQWHPKHSGSIDIRIAADGSWYHEGRVFKRQSLVKLFASVLRREGEDYFLLTPAEKLKIQVEDAPFVATMVDRMITDEQSALVFTTNLDETIVADSQHPIRVEIDPQSQTPRPYVLCRDGLEALISRKAFFELVNMAEEKQRDGKPFLTVSSMGEEFELGCADPEA